MRIGIAQKCYQVIDMVQNVAHPYVVKDGSLKGREKFSGKSEVADIDCSATHTALCSEDVQYMSINFLLHPPLPAVYRQVFNSVFPLTFERYRTGDRLVWPDGWYKTLDCEYDCCFHHFFFTEVEGDEAYYLMYRYAFAVGNYDTAMPNNSYSCSGVDVIGHPSGTMTFPVAGAYGDYSAYVALRPTRNRFILSDGFPIVSKSGAYGNLYDGDVRVEKMISEDPEEWIIAETCGYMIIENTW